MRRSRDPCDRHVLRNWDGRASIFSESNRRGRNARQEEHRNEFMNPLVQFLSIFLLGLVTGVSFSHLLQRGPKATLSGVQLLAVQQVLLRNYGPAIGGLEVAALLSTLAMAILTWREPVVPFLAILSCGCVVLMVTIWAAWINPINKLVNSWTPERLPANWAEFRDRWHSLHTSGSSCPLLPSAQPSTEYWRKARASGRSHRTETSQTVSDDALKQTRNNRRKPVADGLDGSVRLLACAS
jgi:hypothetical protein